MYGIKERIVYMKIFDLKRTFSLWIARLAVIATLISAGINFN